MPLTLRPFSANPYALSKVWFKCSAVNLRIQDINTINSQVKGWLYQDCFEKPSEIVLYRDTKDGGLGLFNVKIRAFALVLSTSVVKQDSLQLNKFKLILFWLNRKLTFFTYRK